MWTIMLVLLYLIFEGLAFLGLIFLEKQKDVYYNPILKTSVSDLHRDMLKIYLANEAYIVHDSLTGWALNPNVEKGLYRINAQGLRGNREYSQIPDSGKIRISVHGDSFTFGDEVNNDQTWAAQLEALDNRLEALNFGVSGYGLDQAFLRYQTLGKRFPGNYVFMCVMPADIRRHVNVFRPFLHSFTGLPLSKPRFILRNDSLKLLPNPMPSINNYREMLLNPGDRIPELGRHDDFFRQGYDKKSWDRVPSLRLGKTLKYAYKKTDPVDEIIVQNIINENSRAFILTQRILTAFYQEAMRRGEKPIVVLLPARKDLTQFRKRGRRIYQPLIAFLQDSGMDWVDLMDGFEKFGKNDNLKTLFMKSHYSPRGNQIVARTLAEYIGEAAQPAPQPVGGAQNPHN